MRAPGYNLTLWSAVFDGLQKFKRKQTAVHVTETTAMASLQIVLKKDDGRLQYGVTQRNTATLVKFYASYL